MQKIAPEMKGRKYTIGLKCVGNVDINPHAKFTLVDAFISVNSFSLQFNSIQFNSVQLCNILSYNVAQSQGRTL